MAISRLLFAFTLGLLHTSTLADWYSVSYGGGSWQTATPDNTKCFADSTDGNYQSQQACEDTLPQPQFYPPCPQCVNFDDQKLILNYETWFKQPWSQVYSQFGLTNASSPLWSPLQIAKIWIVGTLQNSNTPVVKNSPRYSSGGPYSCVNALTVGLQEGGTTGVTGTTTYPYNDGSPRTIWDPAWNLGSNSDELCAPIGGLTAEQCASGSIWQVSNAWEPSSGTCQACNMVGCQSLQNPLCCVRVTFQFASLAINEANSACNQLLNSGATECTPQQYQQGIDPGCFNGPFCLASNGWNSPACKQIFRQVYPNEGKPYCQLAIQACAQARSDLLAAYQAVVATNPEYTNDYNTLQQDDTSNSGIEGICPHHPGDYSVNPPQCTS